jgi:hypothetical protein
MSNENRSGIPHHLIIENRLMPYPRALDRYPALMGIRIQGDVSNLPVRLVQDMPLDTAANLICSVNGEDHEVQIAKAESIPFKVSLKMLWRSDPRYKVEAQLHRRDVLVDMLSNEEKLTRLIPPSARVMKFDLLTKIDDVYAPPFRADKFLPWALEVLAPHRPTHALAEWEPYSDNHETFYKVLEETGGDRLTAVRATWTHRQFSTLGFRLLPRVSITSISDSIRQLGIVRPSPQGNPFTVVHALYEKR